MGFKWISSNNKIIPYKHIIFGYMSLDDNIKLLFEVPFEYDFSGCSKYTFSDFMLSDILKLL